jgi:hypothetical protein
VAAVRRQVPVRLPQEHGRQAAVLVDSSSSPRADERRRQSQAKAMPCLPLPHDGRRNTRTYGRCDAARADGRM